MDVATLFESWLTIHKCQDGWGLAWYLAYEICVRFYVSHGIFPGVNEHEGLGYYGILIEEAQCKINQNTNHEIGRVTASGNVENWITGSPGDHRLNTIEMCGRGVASDIIVAAAIRHPNMPVIPTKSHIHCRHRRRGKSYELMFSVAAILALRNSRGGFSIWNHPYHTEHVIHEIDPQFNISEHPGAFIFIRHEKRVVVSGDGRLLGGCDVNYWNRYMQGESAYTFALEIEELLSVDNHND